MNEEELKITYGAYVGLDWADQKHQGCLKTLDGKKESFTLEHKSVAIASWAAELASRFPGQKIAVGIEQRRGALIYALMQFDFLVPFPINTTTAKSYRNALRSSGAKDDLSDAELLVYFLEKHREYLRPLEPDDPLTLKLRNLAEFRRRLVNDATSVTQRIQAQLKLYYPESLEWLPDLKSELACDFLLTWSTPEKASKARPQKLRAFFHRHNCRKNVEERIQAIKQVKAITRNEEIIFCGQVIVQSLIKQLQVLLESITRLETAITEAFATHPDRAFYESLPGAGPALEPRLAVAMGTDRNRYRSARELQQFSGTAPVTVQSGNSRWVHWRWACPKFTRQSFVEYANASLRYCGWAQDCYDRLKAKGKDHHAALRVVAYKWQRIIFRCWMDRVPYDEQKYLSGLKRKPTLLSPQKYRKSTKPGMTGVAQIIEDLKEVLPPAPNAPAAEN